MEIWSVATLYDPTVYRMAEAPKVAETTPAVVWKGFLCVDTPQGTVLTQSAIVTQPPGGAWVLSFF